MAVAAVALVLSVSACAIAPVLPPEPSTEPPVLVESAEPESHPASPPEADPASETEPALPAFPATCEQMLPLEVAQMGDQTIEAFGEVGRESIEMFLGPKTSETVITGDPTMTCSWGIRYSDGGMNVSAAVVAEEQAASLIAALRDSVYEEMTGSMPGTHVSFHRGEGVGHYHSVTVIIDAPYVITVAGTIGNPSIAESVHVQVQTLNAR